MATDATPGHAFDAAIDDPRALLELGQAALSQGNRAAARACWEQSLARGRAIQDHDPSVMAQLNLAGLELDEGHLTLGSNRLDAVLLAQSPSTG
jgi:hypothetical protein